MIWRSVFSMHSNPSFCHTMMYIVYGTHTHWTNRNYSVHILAKLHIRWWDLIIGAEDTLHLFRWPDRMETAEHKPPLFSFVLFRTSDFLLLPDRYSAPFPICLLSTFSIFCSFFKTFWGAEHINDEIQLYEQKLSCGSRDQKMNCSCFCWGLGLTVDQFVWERAEACKFDCLFSAHIPDSSFCPTVMHIYGICILWRAETALSILLLVSFILLDCFGSVWHKVELQIEMGLSHTLIYRGSHSLSLFFSLSLLFGSTERDVFRFFPVFSVGFAWSGSNQILGFALRYRFLFIATAHRGNRH